ncbi:MAG: hypothetical protein ACREON_12710, partial [Gemmatimonadaceae bacterium]
MQQKNLRPDDGWMWRMPWRVPLIILVTVVAIVAFLDRMVVGELEAKRRDAHVRTERRASALADQLGNTVSNRIGAMRTAKVQFTPVRDSLSERAFLAAADSATKDLVGLSSISVIYADGTLLRGSGAAIGSRRAPLTSDTTVMNAYRRALAGRQTTATAVLETQLGRRVIVFDPVWSGDDSTQAVAVVAGELDPSAILRASLTERRSDTLAVGFYALFGPGNTMITSLALPNGWPAVDHPIRVADTDWTLRMAYEPVNPVLYRATRVALWIGGLTLGVALWFLIYTVRQRLVEQRESIAKQQAEIVRRETAEAEARSLADRLALQAVDLRRAESV